MQLEFSRSTLVCICAAITVLPAACHPVTNPESQLASTTPEADEHARRYKIEPQTKLSHQQLVDALRCRNNKSPTDEECESPFIKGVLSPLFGAQILEHTSFLLNYPGLTYSVAGRVKESSLNTVPPCALRLPIDDSAEGCREPELSFVLQAEDDPEAFMHIRDWASSITQVYAAFLWDKTVQQYERSTLNKRRYFDPNARQYLASLPFEGAFLQADYEVSQEGRPELIWFDVLEEGTQPWSIPNPARTINEIWPIGKWIPHVAEKMSICPGTMNLTKETPWQFSKGAGSLFELTCSVWPPTEAIVGGYEDYETQDGRQEQHTSWKHTSWTAVSSPADRDLWVTSDCTNAKGFESSWSCAVQQRRLRLSDGGEIALLINDGCSDAGCAAVLEVMDPELRENVPSKLVPPGDRRFHSVRFKGEGGDLVLVADVDCSQSEYNARGQDDCTVQKRYRLEETGGLHLVEIPTTMP